MYNQVAKDYLISEGYTDNQFVADKILSDIMSSSTYSEHQALTTYQQYLNSGGKPIIESIYNSIRY